MKHIKFFLLYILFCMSFCGCNGNREVDLAFKATSADLGKNMVRPHADNAYKDLSKLNMEDACKLTLAYFYLLYDDYQKTDVDCFRCCYEKATQNGIEEANSCFKELTGSDEMAANLKYLYDGCSAIEDIFESALESSEVEKTSEDAKQYLPDNEIEMGAVAFWCEDMGQRVMFKDNTYNQLTQENKDKLKPLGMIMKLGSKYYILDGDHSRKVTNWYAAKRNASKCHPYDNGRLRLPTQTEARQIAKIQDDLIYWTDGWDNSCSSVSNDFYYNEIKTFLSDQLPDVWLDAEIKDGSIKIERVTICDEETAEKYQYTEAFYLSEID